MGAVQFARSRDAIAVLEAEFADLRGVLLVRVSVGGELADLTDDDIRLWMFWLGPLDQIEERARPPSAASSNAKP